jgi:hypothetical protein
MTKVLEMDKQYEAKIFNQIKDIRLTGLFRETRAGIGTAYSLEKIEYECLDPDNKTIWIDIKNITEREPT